MSIWPRVPIGEVCDIVSGSTPASGTPEFWNGEVAWVTPKELSSLASTHIHTTQRTITYEGLKSCGARVLPVGAVLFSSRAPIGHTAIVASPMATNQGFKSFVPSPGLDSRFLLRWLRAHRHELEAMGTGATFKEVSKRVVERVEIPLPPLDEQQRIADVLDRAEALRAKRYQALASLDGLLEAIFLEMFPPGNPAGWATLPVAAVCATSSGGTPDRKVPQNYGGEIPWVKSGELHEAIVQSTEESITPLGLTSSSAKRLPAGSVLVAMYGATAGVVSQLGIEAATNQAICALQPRETIRATYLVHALRHSMRDLLEQRAGGAQPNLSQGKVRAHMLLVPPLDEQTAFELRFDRLERLRNLWQTHLEALDALFASVQQRAFLGRLFDGPLPTGLVDAV